MSATEPCSQVEQYNKKAEDRGIDPECMKAICTELKGNGDELGGAKFDVVLVRPLPLHMRAPN